jgi:hypothetical protein
MTAIINAAGAAFPLFSPKNKGLLDTATGLMSVIGTRIGHIMKGRWVDVDRHAKDCVYGIPQLSQQDAQKDFIRWPLPEMTTAEKIKKSAQQVDIALCAVRFR